MNVGDVLERRFELKQILYEGALAQVFKAWDRELEHYVAIKTLPPQLLTDPIAVQALQREVRLSQKLSHPNVVSIHDYRAHARTRCTVMEFVEGELPHYFTPEQLNRRLDESTFRAFAGQFLSAVEYDHSKDVIHRGLRPANTMVTQELSARLKDFGIVAAIKASYTRRSVRSPAQTVLYSSPEQIRGEDPSAGTDIYGLGCVFYEMLSGHPPFYQGETLCQYLNEEPGPISSVTPHLNQTVLACLAKVAPKRPQSVAEIRDALASDRTVRIKKSAPPSQLLASPPRSEVRAEGYLTVPLLLMTLFVVMGLAGPWWWWLRSQRIVQQPASDARASVRESPPPVQDTRSPRPPRVEQPIQQPERQTWPGGPRPAEPLVVNGARMAFILIPPGEFVMGCSPGDSECDDDEKPAHVVGITRPFEIGKYEVTQAEWEAVMGTNPSHFEGANRPVEEVTWNDVQEFLAKLNARNDGYHYRLPTEAEWEYAARAETTGKHAGDLDAMAWYDSNSGSQTHPVGQRKPNVWGLHSMHGNVREWCQDRYEEGYYRWSPTEDPAGPQSGRSRVLRGGSWISFAGALRVSDRVRSAPGFRLHLNGFRCVRERK